MYPKRHETFSGGYRPEPGVTDLSNVEKVIERHYYYDNKLTSISENAIHYLDSMISLCSNYHIVPVLVSNPLNRSYLERIPDTFIQRYNQLKIKYKNQGIIVLDYSHEHYRDDYFFNPDHLNVNGSKIFSQQIRYALTHEISVSITGSEKSAIH